MKSKGQREAIHGTKYHRFEEQSEEFIGICISIPSPISSGQLNTQIFENKCGMKINNLGIICIKVIIKIGPEIIQGENAEK